MPKTVKRVGVEKNKLIMALSNTTIIPPGNSGQAQSLLTDLLNEADAIKVVIFGNGNDAQNAVQLADTEANSVTSGISRKVAWLQDTGMLDLLKSIVKSGSVVSISEIDLSQHIGISVSVHDTLKCLIQANPAPDSLDMGDAFVEAGTSE
jgi:hypothetical protein